ncbi:MAG: hypothetical protein QOF72_1583 [Blastocatellia bacterium]|jgi:hypothetical protein|nr:hypothetical protein [Blastocatellia bacterium]
MKALVLIVICCIVTFAQTRPSGAGTVTVTRGDGGSIQTRLSSNIAVNDKSTLHREWITIHDSACPISLVDNIGVTTVYVPDRVRGDYEYSAIYTVEAKEPVSAFEVRFLLFDLWGNHLKTLSTTEVEDLQDKKEFKGRWNLYSENEISEYYASIAFVARVRTQSGRVFEADTVKVLEEARKFSRKFSPENLEPKAQKP